MVRRVLIKIGGRAFEGERGFKELAATINANREIELIIVHGGGSEISQALTKAHRETRFIDGIRVTSAEDIKIVEKVLSEKINQRIAIWLSAGGVACQRMSGKTQKLFLVEPLTRGGQDLGYVGRIKQVNAGIVLDTLKNGQVPVISPISADEKGQSYNVNADSAAAALAAGALCTDLVFITDVPGVMVDDEIQPTITVQHAQALIAEGMIKGGMVAKMEAAFEALKHKVPRVHIVHWFGPDTLKAIMDHKSISGTIIQ